MTGAATSGACNCVDWFKQKVALDAYSYDDLAKAEAVRTERPYFLPFLFGERCPGWNDEKAAGFFELRPSHSVFDLYLSVLEGVLFNIYQCYEEIRKASGIPKNILLSGGILKSKVWLQMAADIFQRPLSPDRTDQSSLMGAAYLAEDILLGHRVRPQADRSAAAVLPDPGNRSYFQARYERYQQLYQTES
jgi:gluconokinase